MYICVHTSLANTIQVAIMHRLLSNLNEKYFGSIPRLSSLMEEIRPQTETGGAIFENFLYRQNFFPMDFFFTVQLSKYVSRHCAFFFLYKHILLHPYFGEEVEKTANFREKNSNFVNRKNFIFISNIFTL